MTFGKILAAAFGAALAIGGPASAAGYALHDAEIISVNGNSLIVRDGNSAADYTVASGSFTVGGAAKTLALLRPGMKVSGSVTTPTAPVAMSLVELHDATVAYTKGGNLIVGGDQPDQYRHFSGDTMGDRGVLIYRSGVLVQPSSLRAGDRITATVVTKLPPKEMGVEDVLAFTDAEKRKPATVRSVANTPKINRAAANVLMQDSAASDVAAPAPEPVVSDATTAPASPSLSPPSAQPRVVAPPPRPAPTPAATPAPAPPAAAPTARPKQLPHTASALPAVALGGLALAGLGAILTLRRRLGAGA